MSAHTPHTLQDEFPHDAATLTWLKRNDTHFARLAERYHALNRSIHRIEVEVECASDAYLTQLRKQRLALLDAIAVMIEEAELAHVGANAGAKAVAPPVDTPTPPAVGLFGRGAPVAA